MLTTETTPCPSCRQPMVQKTFARQLHGLDLARVGRFNYYRCLQKHGRFTTFAQFMIEKGFVRQLTAAELGELKEKVGVVRCTSCGAPIDIRRDSACSHCRSPIAILDPEAVEQALAGYQQAEVRRTTVDIEALGDAIVMREKEKSRWQREQRQGRIEDIDIGDLLVTGVEMAWKLLRR